LLLRAAGVWLRGNECVIAFVVAAWLGWVALGSLAGHACARRRPLRTAVLTLLLAVVSAVSVLAVLRCYWTFSSVLPGEALDLARSMLLAIVATSLPCFFFGATFGATARACAALGADPSVPTPPTVAWLYVCESIGAMLAGVVATFVLIPLQRWWFALAIVAAAPLMTRPRVLTIAAALALLIGAWHADPRLERVASRCASQFLTGPIVCDLDMPRERLVITRRAGEHAFYFNGRLAGSSMQSEQAEELAWFSLLSARTPRTALLLGFPYNGLAAALLQAGIRVTVVDPDAYRLGALTPFLNAPDRAALTNDMLRVVRDDWRTYASASSQRFDLIIQDTGIPETYALARFFSVEWFALVARLLGSNGALAVVLPGSPGYVPDDLARVLARVRLTMQHGLQPGASNAVRLVPAGATLLIGASAPTPACDAAYYTNALAVSSIKPPLGWFSRALIEDYVSPLRLRQFDTACAAQHVTQPQYDLIPRSYGDAVLYSESRFNSTLHALLARLYGSPVQMRRGLGVAGAILCALVVLLIMRRGASCAAPLLMACASAAGFTLEMLALIRYTPARSVERVPASARGSGCDRVARAGARRCRGRNAGLQRIDDGDRRGCRRTVHDAGVVAARTRHRHSDLCRRRRRRGAGGCADRRRRAASGRVSASGRHCRRAAHRGCGCCRVQTGITPRGVLIDAVFSAAAA
jgi:predicted membrane-bound spermidine synthase